MPPKSVQGGALKSVQGTTFKVASTSRAIFCWASSITASSRLSLRVKIPFSGLNQQIFRQRPAWTVYLSRFRKQGLMTKPRLVYAVGFLSHRRQRTADSTIHHARRAHRRSYRPLGRYYHAQIGTGPGGNEKTGIRVRYRLPLPWCGRKRHRVCDGIGKCRYRWPKWRDRRRHHL